MLLHSVGDHVILKDVFRYEFHLANLALVFQFRIFDLSAQVLLFSFPCVIVIVLLLVQPFHFLVAKDASEAGRRLAFTPVLLHDPHRYKSEVANVTSKLQFGWIDWPVQKMSVLFVRNIFVSLQVIYASHTLVTKLTADTWHYSMYPCVLVQNAFLHKLFLANRTNVFQF